MYNKPDHYLQRIIFFTGISSIVTQLITLRECYAQFHGNAFVIAMIFFVWLAAGSLGTLMVRYCPSCLFSLKNLGLLCLILSILPAFQIIAIRIFRSILFIPGTDIGFYNIFKFIIVSIWPYAFLIGFALPFTYQVYKIQNSNLDAAIIYIYDNAGDALGGLLFSFFLIQMCSPILASLMINVSLLIMGIVLLAKPYRTLHGFIICLVFILFFMPMLWEKSSLNIFQGDMVNYTESRYCRIQVFHHENQYVLVEDGIPRSNEGNIAIEETIVHCGLAQLNSVRRVLTLSANKGIIREIKKYHPLAVDNVEIDATKSLIEQEFDFINIDGLNMFFMDGRQYIRQTNLHYDAIILNLPEPDTFQVNRFFTDRFFDMAALKLTSEGILVFCVEGFDSYLSKTHQHQISTLYQTASHIFDEVKIFPGEQIIFVCRNAPIQMDIPKLLSLKNIETNYIQYFFDGDISKQRIQYIHHQLIDSAEINQDYQPVLVRQTVEKWLSVFHTDLTFFLIILIFLCCFYILIIRSTEFVLFSSGMTVMGFEILLIFLFQMTFGYVYYQVCWIVTFFLIGLLPGAYFSMIIIKKHKESGKKLMIICDLAMIVLIIFFVLILTWFQNCLHVFFFSFYGLLLSMLCGFQFPIALHQQSGKVSTITRFFAADILGAAFGIIFVSIVGIPFCGLLWTALGLGLLKCFSLLRVITL
jgi:spermidine synthase